MKTWYSCVPFYLVLALLVPATAQAQNPASFFLPPSFPNASIVADLNGDGKPDLIGPDGSVHLGNGDGTFTGVTTLSVTGAMAVGDFNGDGKPDVVVSSSSPSQLSLYVFLGNGDGTFQPPVRTIIGVAMSSLSVADFNGDGKSDLAGTVPGLPLLVLIGKGDGTFAAPVQYGPAINTTVAMTTGDFNHDGKADVATLVSSLNGTSGSIAVFLGKGDGTFQPPTMSAGVAIPQFLVAADINGDGRLDLVVGGGAVTSIFLGNGDGSFQAAISQLPFGPFAVADVNGDGKPDLLITGSPFLGVYLGKGDGTFTTLNVNYLIGISSGPPLVADFNRDGKLDVGVNGFLLLGNGDGTFRGNLLSVGGIGFGVSWLSADFNGDGNLDIALIQASANGSGVSVLLGDGTGGFVTAPGTLVVPESTSLSLSIGDFNGDGKLDLLVAGLATSETLWRYSVLLGNGDGTFRPPITSGPQQFQDQVRIVVADFNGDHISDFAFLNDFGIGVYLGKGDGTFAAPAFFALTGSPPGSIVAGDFNNDGSIDIVATVLGGIDILLGNGDGTFQPAEFTAYNLTEFNAPALLAAAVDLNGDGNLDLLGGGPYAPAGPGGLDINADVLLGNGDGTFGTLISNHFGLSQNNSGVGIADINGDGILDLVTSNSQGLQIALGNGDGTFGGASTLLPPSFPDIGGLGKAVLVADFNKDGRPDIAITESANASGLVVLLNTAPPPTPDFLIAAKPLRPATLAPGNSATSTVTLTAVGGFSATVALSCTGLPSGATCGFTPASLPSASGTSKLTISTTSSTTAGTYPVMIVGTSSGPTHQRVVTLTVATSTGTTTASLTPQTLTFAQQTIGSPSSPQVATLTNTGMASLNMPTMAISGTNAGDFSQTNTCNSGLAAGTNCQISVIFNPTGMGSRSATLAVSDNATGSPQMVSLAGSGPDFSIAPGATSTATVMPGQTATYMISVAPGGGFAQTVALACAGAPAKSTCTVSPSSVVLSGAAQTAMVSITTTAGAALFGPTGRDLLLGIHEQTAPVVLALSAMGLLIALFLRRPGPGHRWGPVTLGVLLCAAVLLTSCGGGSSSGGGGGVDPGTQAGTYTITVSGTFTSGATTLTHQTNLTLVVQ